MTNKTETSPVQTPMIKKGVKVLYRKSRTVYESCYAPTPGTIQYPIRKWVGPQGRCGPLAVFDTLENARLFIKVYHVSRAGVWECEYIPSNYQVLWVVGVENLIRPYCPVGTQFADKVRIVNLIERI